MNKWTEIRTAYSVAQLGTISAAAEALGIHRATVTRHIDALEATLGGKVFLRHTKGYSLTEIGEDLLRVADITNEQFEMLAIRTKNRSSALTGELVITSVEIATPFLINAIKDFQVNNPDVRVRYLVSEQKLKLEYGEAHIAIRSGRKPKDQDNFAKHLLTLSSGLYAHKVYIEKFGKPESPGDLSKHRFVISEGRDLNLTFFKWIKKHITEEQIFFRSSNQRVNFNAVCSGIGVGFLPVHIAEQQKDLVQLFKPKKAWDINFWVVTHADQHESPKVQEFLKSL